jgi:hypothetical protein
MLAQILFCTRPAVSAYFQITTMAFRKMILSITIKSAEPSMMTLSMQYHDADKSAVDKMTQYKFVQLQNSIEGYV